MGDIRPSRSLPRPLFVVLHSGATSVTLLAAADAVLRWSTALEVDHAGFEVEHRVEDLSPGRHGFRLKQPDRSGAFAYSPGGGSPGCERSSRRADGAAA